MLGIAYEHDASFAARCSLEHRDDSVIGPGLAMPSPRAACHGKGRALVSRTTSLLASRRRRSGTCSQSRLRMQTTPYSTHERRAPSMLLCRQLRRAQQSPRCQRRGAAALRLAASSTCCVRAAARRVLLFALLVWSSAARETPQLATAWLRALAQ